MANRITVVILTYNCEDRITRTLAKMRASAPKTPFIVVDNASTDATAQVIREEFPEVTLVVLPKNIGAAARNEGARLAKTPYVAFADDDMWWEAGSLRAAADFLDRHPKVALVNAHTLVGPSRRVDPFTRVLQQSPLPDKGRSSGRPILGFMAGAVMVRRKAFLASGGYDERVFIGGEEEWLAAALAERGWQLRYLPQATVRHYPSRSNFIRLTAHRMSNAILFYWMRRPVAIAARKTWRMLQRVPKDNSFIKGIALTLRRLPWVASERRKLPGRIEEQLRLLESSKPDRR